MGTKNEMIYGKIAPQAIDLEKVVLGAIMIESKAFDIIYDVLQPECFYLETHQNIFQAMSSLAAKRMPIDLLTVVEELKSRGKLDQVGGPFYVSQLTNNVVSSANIHAHALIVMQKYLSREMISICGNSLSDAYSEARDVFEMLDSAEEKISALRIRNIKKTYRNIASIARESVDIMEGLRARDESITGVHSGFEDLDMVTCGWQPTDLIILAARPSVGKTAFSLTLAGNAADKFREQYQQDKSVPQKSVAIFSLEMKDTQLVNRMISKKSNVWLWRLKNGKLTDEHMDDINKSVNQMSSALIFVDDTPSLQITEFRSKARILKRKENVGLIIVDYLQLMRANKNNREQEISMISQELKATAKELDIPIIALSQMSRDIEKTGQKIKREPQASDLRESGAIEQDADMIIFLWKPTDDEMLEDAALKTTFYAKIAKHRNGALAKFIGKFVGDTQTHEYLKVVDNNSLNPLGSNWKPVDNLPALMSVDFSVPKKDNEPEEELPF